MVCLYSNEADSDDETELVRTGPERTCTQDKEQIVCSAQGWQAGELQKRSCLHRARCMLFRRKERIKAIELTRAEKASTCSLKKQTNKQQKRVAAVFRCWC